MENLEKTLREIGFTNVITIDENTYATKDEIKKEALFMMKTLKLNEKAIKQFKDEGVVSRSEVIGILYWATDEEKAFIKELEEKGMMVYHIIRMNTNYGLMSNYLYVSDYKDDWEVMKECVKKGQVHAYVKNETDDSLSDVGSIMVKPINGGLMREF